MIQIIIMWLLGSLPILIFFGLVWLIMGLVELLANNDSEVQQAYEDDPMPPVKPSHGLTKWPSA